MSQEPKIETIETVWLPVGMRKALWDHARAEIGRAKTEISTRESAIVQFKRNIDFWQKVVTGCEHGICAECKGQGGFREFVDQDETQWHRCKKCNGTGEEKEPSDLIGKIGALAPKDGS